MVRVRPCDACGAPAVHSRHERSLTTIVNTAQHYCAACFLADIEGRVADAITTHRMIEPGDRVLLCVSGEKDSVVMMHLVAGWVRDHACDVQLTITTVDEGIGDHRTRCLELTRRHAVERGIPFIAEAFATRYGATLDEVYDARADNGYRICTYCCGLRGRAVREVVLATGANKVASGANLNDGAEFGMVALLNGEISPQALPVHTPNGGEVTFIRPLLGVTSLECGLYARLRGLDLISEDCRYCAEHFHDDVKHLLSGLEDRNPGVMAQLYAGYCRLAGAPLPSSTAARAKAAVDASMEPARHREGADA